MALGQPSRLARPERLTRSIPGMLSAPSPSISFEFFPPKDDASEALLWDAIRRLESVRGRTLDGGALELFVGGVNGAVLRRVVP